MNLQKIAENLSKHKDALILASSLCLGVFGGTYLVVTRTSWIHGAPIICSPFRTKAPGFSNGIIDICVNGVSAPYAPDNGDLELNISFLDADRSSVHADVVFWTADVLGGREVDYVGEYNVEKVRVYRGNWLVTTIDSKFSAWVDPLVPADVREPLWSWIKENQRLFRFHNPPISETIHDILETFLGATTVTVSVVLSVTRGMALIKKE